MRIKSLAIGLSLVLLGFGLGGRASSAAPTGLTISPAFQMVTIQAGAASQPVSFKITNDQPAAQDLSFSVRDFNTLNESGGLFFVGTNPTALQKKYGLAKWLSLSTSQVIIQPHQTFTLDGQILNQPSLSPGGHYGALLISIGGGPAGGQVSLEPIASSLLFVTKPAGATHFLSLSNVSFKHSLLSLPPAVNLRFQNTGNTHVVPRGVVNITDGHGRLISKGIINQNSAIVLPQTYRQLSVPMQKIVSPGRPGQYQLTVDFRFDGINQYRRYQTGLWYLPRVWLALPAGLILVVLAAVLVQRRKKRRAH